MPSLQSTATVLALAFSLTPSQGARAQGPASLACGEKSEAECVGADERTIECRAKTLGDCTRDEADSAKMQNHNAAANLYHAAAESYLKAFRSVLRINNERSKEYLSSVISMLDKESRQWQEASTPDKALRSLSETRNEIQAFTADMDNPTLVLDTLAMIDDLKSRVHRQDATRKQLGAEIEPRHGMAAEKFLDAADAWAQARKTTKSCEKKRADLKEEIRSRLDALERRRLDAGSQSWSPCQLLRASKEALIGEPCLLDIKMDPDSDAIDQRIDLELQVCGEIEATLMPNESGNAVDIFCAGKWFEQAADKALRLPFKELAFRSRDAQVGWVAQELAKRAIAQYKTVALVWDRTNAAAAQEVRQRAVAMLDRLGRDRDFLRLSTSIRPPVTDYRRFIGRDRRLFIAGITLLSVSLAVLVPAVALNVAGSEQCGPGGTLSCNPPPANRSATSSLLSGSQAMYVISGVAAAAGVTTLGIALSSNRRSRRLPSCVVGASTGLACSF